MASASKDDFVVESLTTGDFVLSPLLCRARLPRTLYEVFFFFL